MKLGCKREPAKIKELYTNCPPEYLTIMQHLDLLDYYGTPNYTEMYRLLRQALTNRRLQETYDWERPNWLAIKNGFAYQ